MGQHLLASRENKGMTEYFVKIWHEHELMWQFIAEDVPGIYKSVKGPHIQNKESKIHPLVVAWAEDSDIPIKDVMYAVIPLKEFLDCMRRRGKLFC